MYPAFFPTPSVVTYNWGAGQPIADMWARIGSVYHQSMQQASQELWTSSMRIIQDHLARAWMDAPQSCMSALAQNAAEVQQRAMVQLMGANDEATAIVAEEINEASVTTSALPV
ncbi:hypothetical protein [Pseudoduganella namucuonensis]|nr:hypothetical protein [Pseudoduganella namucuonensis]